MTENVPPSSSGQSDRLRKAAGTVLPKRKALYQLLDIANEGQNDALSPILRKK